MYFRILFYVPNPCNQLFLHSPMTSRIYKVKATMNSAIWDIPTVESWFIFKISFVLMVNIIHNGRPTKIEHRAVRNSLPEVFCKKVVLKKVFWHRKTPVPESLFNQVVGLTKTLRGSLLFVVKPFQPSVHIETSHLIIRANQITSFYMKRNTGMKWINMTVECSHCL